MRRIEVRDKTHLKELLYEEFVLGIKGDKYCAFGGFQLWWYDKHHDRCDCCEATWSDPRKRVHHYSLDKAAKTLWRHRRELYVRTKHAGEDHKIQIMEHLDDTQH